MFNVALFITNIYLNLFTSAFCYITVIVTQNTFEETYFNNECIGCLIIVIEYNYAWNNNIFFFTFIATKTQDVIPSKQLKQVCVGWESRGFLSYYMHAIDIITFTVKHTYTKDFKGFLHSKKIFQMQYLVENVNIKFI